MRKLALFVLLIASSALAQTSPWSFYGGYAHALQKPNAGTYIVSEGGESFAFQPCAADSAEILGASLQHALCARRDFHGFDLSLERKLTPTLGWRSDVSAYFDKTESVDTFGQGVDQHVDTNRLTDRTVLALTGIEWSTAVSGRWRPFGHVLAGLARQTSNDRQTSTGPFDFTLHDSVTSFALKVGGGLDIPISSRVDLRLIQIDYTPIFARGRHVSGNADFDERVKGKTANNVTLSFGIVIR
jgi:hypothetical protein